MLGASGQQQQQQHNHHHQHHHHHQIQQQQHELQPQQKSLNNPSNQQHHHHQLQHLVNHRTSSTQKPNADDDYQDDHGMRVGHNYQAEIPQFIAYSPAPEYYEDEKAIRVWSPYNKIPDHVLDEFINKAKDKFFYNIEQALGMLSWHKFDLNRAYADLPNFVPYPNEWSVEDKVLFEQAYQFHEKQFSKIKQMLPDKSMASLINYYYGWKKTRTRASLMERQTRRFAAKRETDSNDASDDDEGGDENDNKAVEKLSGASATGSASTGKQGNDDDEKTCREPCCDPDKSDEPNIVCDACDLTLRSHSENHAIIIDTISDNFCEKCYIVSRTRGVDSQKLVQVGDCFYSRPEDQCQRQILFAYTDVLDLVTGAPEQGDFMLKSLDSQVEDAKRDIQLQKQKLSQINEKIQPIADQISDLNMDEFADIMPEYKPTNNWTPEETQLVIQGLRRYGTDFSAISDVVRTKSPESISSFFASQKDRLGLDLLVKDFEQNKRWCIYNSDGQTNQEQKQLSQKQSVSAATIQQRT